LDGGADRLRAVAQREDVDRRRHGRPDARQLSQNLVDGVDDIGAGLLVDDEENGALAVRPGGLRRILRAGHGLADVAHSQRPTVAVGDNDVVPIVGFNQLIVRIDRERAIIAIDRALGAVDGHDRERRAHVLEREPFGHELGRVELDANRRFLLAADGDLGDA
jgi:hypothetical protein